MKKVRLVGLDPHAETIARGGAQRRRIMPASPTANTSPAPETQTPNRFRLTPLERSDHAEPSK